MIRRLFRFAKLLLKHPGIPHWLKVGMGVCLLIPGPVDELLIAPVVVALLIVRRSVVLECWHRSGEPRYESAGVMRVEWARIDGIDTTYTNEGDLL